MKKVLVCLAGLLCLVIGCATGPSVCDTMESEQSILCDMARDREVRIEDVGSFFVAINSIAIGEGVYTREEAVAICKELRDALDGGISYIAFRYILTDSLDKYPELKDVVLSYLNTFNLDTEIYRADRDLLISWLDARIVSLGG